MKWIRILAPMLGSEHDEPLLRAAVTLASPFAARITGVYAAPTPGGMIWSMGGPGVEAAIASVHRAASDGEERAEARLDALSYEDKAFVTTSSEDWAGLRMNARLSDVVVFGPDAATGDGFLAPAFQQILMDERRPVLLARGSFDPDAPVAVAWDGGREASRAARRATPWLQRAKEVIVLTAPESTPREFEPTLLVEYLADRGVSARLEQLSTDGEAGRLLLEAAGRLGAELLVAGAFGHPRFQRFIFGGTTRRLLDSPSGPTLFLSH